MSNIPRLIITLLLLLFPFVASGVHADAETERHSPEEFISELVDYAALKDTSEHYRAELLEVARRFARTHSELTGDEAFQGKIDARIVSASALTTTAFDKGLDPTDPKLYEKMLDLQRHAAKVRARVFNFVTGLIEKALEADTDRARLLTAATAFAKSYGEMKNDDSFHQRIEHIVATLPSSDLSSDDEILQAFQEAMLEDNSLVKKFIVTKLGARAKPFITKLIDEAVSPITPATRKNELLATAMNLAKSYGEMRGDQSFHKSIHRRTFTARLSKPVASEPTGAGGRHEVHTPEATLTIINIFTPDNIVIKRGETVRWVNHDKVAHVIGTFDFLSDGHFFAPHIAPSREFEFTFTEAGDYYYICYIHKSMIGKIQVE